MRSENLAVNTHSVKQMIWQLHDRAHVVTALEGWALLTGNVRSKSNSSVLNE